MSAPLSAYICAAGVLLVCTAVLGDRVVSRQAEPNRVTVLYWEKWTEQEGEEMRKVVNAFNASQDRIFVKYLSISGVDQKTMLATAGGDPPDVAGIWVDQLYQFSDAGALTDLTSMAARSGLTPDYYIKGFYDALTYRGKLWALPSTPASIALHVRSDLVPPEYAGPDKFPKTIEGMDKLVDMISRKDSRGEIELAGFLPSNPGWWNWAWGLYWGGKLIEGDRITVNSPENVAAFTWVQSYAKRFGAKQVQNFQSGFGTFSSPQDPFMSGKVAMEMNGVWKANYIRVYRPGTKWFAVPMPYPQGRSDLAGHTNLSQDVLVIPRGAKHVKEAFEFIRFVQRQEVMEGLCQGHGKNSPLARVSDKFFETHQNPYIRLFDRLSRSKNAFSPPKIGILPQITSEMNVAFQEVNTGQKQPKQALDDAENRLNGLWATYRRQILGEVP